MALRVRHKKVSTLPDGPDAQQVRSSDWNEEHLLEGKVSVGDIEATNVPSGSKFLRGDGSWQNVTASGDSFEFEQTVADVLWVVNHNLTRFVDVVVTDLSGNEIGCDIQRVTLDQVQVSFATPSTGRVLVK